MGRSKKPTKEVLQQREAEALALEARNTSLIRDLLNGSSHKQLAEAYGISPSTVRDVIRNTRELWKDWRVKDFDTQLLNELERINWIEDQAREAWEKSKEPLITQTRRTDGTYMKDSEGDYVLDENGKRRLNVLYDEIKKQDRHPDPRYLDKISWCVEQRLRIIGAYAPEKHAATTPDGKQYAPFSIIEVVLPPEPKEEPIMIEATVESVEA